MRPPFMRSGGASGMASPLSKRGVSPAEVVVGEQPVGDLVAGLEVDARTRAARTGRSARSVPASPEKTSSLSRSRSQTPPRGRAGRTGACARRARSRSPWRAAWPAPRSRRRCRVRSAGEWPAMLRARRSSESPRRSSGRCRCLERREDQVGLRADRSRRVVAVEEHGVEVRVGGPGAAGGSRRRRRRRRRAGRPRSGSSR